MPTERLEIIITEKGSRTVTRNITNVGAAATKTGSSLGFMKKALLAIGSSLVIRGLIRLSDAFTNIQNRLGTVTTGTQELIAVTEELFALSRRTRTSFEATAEIFTRTALATRNLGLSQRDTLKFTESLNQATILSGAGVREANNALIQLSQGLSSGALRGDELRSVLEQLPVVADVIAKGLGVTRGELRALGAEGKISAEDIILAFQDAREELAERFGKTVPTIGQSFVVLRNAVIKMIGAFNQSSGASTNLANTLLFLADNLENVARVGQAVVFVLGVQYATRAIPRAIAATRAFTLAIAANPIGLMAVALTTVIGLLIAFDDKIKISSEGAGTLADGFAVAFDEIKLGFGVVKDTAEDALGGLGVLTEAGFGDVDLSIRSMVTGVATGLDLIIGLFKGLGNVVEVIFNDFPKFLDDVFRSMIKTSVGFVNDLALIFSDLTGIGVGTPLDINDFIKVDPNKITKTGLEIQQALLTGIVDQTGAVDAADKFFLAVDKKAAERIGQAEKDKRDLAGGQAGLDDTPGGPGSGGGRGGKSGGTTIDDILADLDRERQLVQATAQERGILNDIFRIENSLRRELSDKEKLNIENQLRELQLLDIRRATLENIMGPQQLLIDQQSELNKLFAEGTITAQQYQIALTGIKIAQLEMATTSGQGFLRGLQQIKLEMLDVAGAAENVVVNAFKGAEDALVSFVQTGEFNISSLVDSILADLTRLLVKEAFSSLIGLLSSTGTASGGGGGGGIAGIALSALSAFGGARAGGGSVNPNQDFLVGERGPELFRPNQPGNIVPNSSLMAGAAAPPQVNLQVVNVESETDVPAAMSSREGDQVFLNSLARNKRAAKTALGLA